MTKSEGIGLRVSADQRARWEAAARRDGRSLSAWIARQCDVATTPPAPVYAPDKGAP
jgi:hypothetical protein